MTLYKFLSASIEEYSIEEHLVQGTVDWGWVSDWARSNNLPSEIIDFIKLVSDENGTSYAFAKNIGDFLYAEFLYDKNTRKEQIKYIFDIIFVKKRLTPHQIKILFSNFINENINEWEKIVSIMLTINSFF
ncbi:hypothetical protein PL71_17345 [Pseudoalteromonas distincta]|uniref:Uncharacterized protein n=1 Tax=Pseudoalteromonas distincta TaxID=77608 RepID=A0ABT9GGF0_9GAMM|nr:MULTISPECIES: hypothetical protein [Pseudoalteromonas distincta group]KHM45255.1 hypothetical protein PL71_17345 [Pseudoalteromonas elyakovii]KID39105.1 hypothetical protein QT16_08295 [Pseudoalteromonas distincta]MDP4484966.1 hypothetical protein [Pseudoalteromonas elyakovii]